MTLIIVAANHNFIVQVSDRRLTSGITVVDEEATKAIYLETPTAQAIIGYSGLARIGNQPMNEIIIDLLEHRALPISPMDPMQAIDEFARALNELFRTRAVTRYAVTDRGLTVMVTAYFFTTTGWVGPVQWRITNFQDWESGYDSKNAWPEFTMEFEDPIPGTPVDDMTMVQRIGKWSITTLEEMEELRDLLAPGLPPRAARDKAVNMINVAAGSAHSIGRQMNSVILRPGQPPQWKYHTALPSDSIYLGDVIGVEEDGSVVKAYNQIVRRVDGIAVVPKTHPSASCPCGSRRAYKYCHGLIR